MGTSRSVPEFVGKITKSAEAVRAGNSPALTELSRTAERVMDGSISSMTGGRMVARNAPTEGHPRRMSAKAGGVSGTDIATCIVGPKGPVALIENPVPPHEIGSGKKSRGKKGGFTGSGSELLTIPNEDVVLYGPFAHPGTAGKHRWVAARETLPRILGPQMLENSARRALAPFL